LENFETCNDTPSGNAFVLETKAAFVAIYKSVNATSEGLRFRGAVFASSSVVT